MAKYHINPYTGISGICKATVNPCRFGENTEHYSNPEDALAAVESQLEKDYGSVPSSLRSEVKLNERGYLTPEFAADAAPSGVSCPECSTAVDYAQGARMLSNDYVTCSNCGNRFDMFSATVEIAMDSESAKFLDIEEVRNAVWYHATTQEDWLENIDGEESWEAHVGTENAAFDRALSEYATHGSRSRSFYLYEVRLNPEANISSEILDDENAKELIDTGSDVNRYVNRWEDMASISLAVRPEMLQIQSRKLVEPEIAHRRVSLYNVDPRESHPESVLP